MGLKTKDNYVEDDCDKYLKRVSRINLMPVKFLYLDYNDKSHEDRGNGYRQ